MRTPSILIRDQFSKHARPLRKYFESVYADPRQAHPKRFVWDFWSVPNQYQLLRTPAYHYFPEPLYKKFHEELVLWGRKNLGCHDISPPWMSMYLEGCGQEFHGDLPHGPWAFVFSITPWKNRKFTGGETFLLKEEILDFWKNFNTRSLERDEILTHITPEFNRLTVFDPRLPHGVKQVRGTTDPREARLVIHGWFVQPRPFIEGPIKTSELEEFIEAFSYELTFQNLGPLSGVCSVQFTVNPSGKTSKIKFLTQNVRGLDPGISDAPARLSRFISEKVSQFQFSKKKTASLITLPLIFEA